MFKKYLLVVIVLSLFAGQALAQGIGFGPQVGYYKSKDADEGEFTFGATLRLKLSKSLAIEGSINYRQEKYANDMLTVKSWPVMATALFYPIPIVYGAIGAGWYNTTYDYDQNRFLLMTVEDKTEQEFGWHFGGGLELPVGSGTRLIADVRYVFIDYDFEQVPGTEGLESNFYIATIGILWGL